MCTYLWTPLVHVTCSCMPVVKLRLIASNHCVVRCWCNDCAVGVNISPVCTVPVKPCRCPVVLEAARLSDCTVRKLHTKILHSREAG